LSLGRPAREGLHNVVRQACHIFFLTRVGIGVWRSGTPQSSPLSQIFQGESSSPGRFASHSYSMMLVTTPAPTVRPPSRIAKRSFSSIAIGVISSIVTAMLSPGITISVPSGRDTTPVTSVVRK